MCQPLIENGTTLCDSTITLSEYCSYQLIARNNSFQQAPDIDLRYETETRKVVVEFKFNALYR